VEVQALWFNALRVLENLAANFGDIVQQKHCQRLATRVEQSFNEKFWNPAIGCLHDVVTDSGVDSSVRPNQILAVSLPYSMLPAERARHVVETVERELLTPFGLRSLSPRDERYQGRYAGDPSLRDAAYHQGTVWTWLIGPFVTAFFKVNGRTEATRRQVSLWLQKLCAHLHEAGLGQVSEIFDGDPPHKPRGCFAQAWSVAELLRVLSEEQLDLLQWQTAS
jgi:glycogen debranching enzyme